jgi:hypothetical protein
MQCPSVPSDEKPRFRGVFGGIRRQVALVIESLAKLRGFNLRLVVEVGLDLLVREASLFLLVVPSVLLVVFLTVIEALIATAPGIEVAYTVPPSEYSIGANDFR